MHSPEWVVEFGWRLVVRSRSSYSSPSSSLGYLLSWPGSGASGGQVPVTVTCPSLYPQGAFPSPASPLPNSERTRACWETGERVHRQMVNKNLQTKRVLAKIVSPRCTMMMQNLCGFDSQKWSEVIFVGVVASSSASIHAPRAFWSAHWHPGKGPRPSDSPWSAFHATPFGFGFAVGRIQWGGVLSTKKLPTFKTIQKLQSTSKWRVSGERFTGSLVFRTCLLGNNFGGILLHISQDLREVRRWSILKSSEHGIGVLHGGAGVLKGESLLPLWRCKDIHSYMVFCKL